MSAWARLDYLLLMLQGAAQEALEKYSHTLSVEYNGRVCRKLVRHLKSFKQVQHAPVYP